MIESRSDSESVRAASDFRPATAMSTGRRRLADTRNVFFDGNA